MKTKLLEEDILLYALTLTFLYFSRTRCPTEVISSRSNTHYCRSLSDDRRLFPALLSNKYTANESFFVLLHISKPYKNTKERTKGCSVLLLDETIGKLLK